MVVHSVLLSVTANCQDFIDVSVIATGEAGDHVMPFRMRPETVFAKLMQRWCAYHNITFHNARFTLCGCELSPEDTPKSIGLCTGTWPVAIRAAPQKSNASRALPEGASLKTARVESVADGSDDVSSLSDCSTGGSLSVDSDRDCLYNAPSQSGCQKGTTSTTITTDPIRVGIEKREDAQRVSFRVVAEIESGERSVLRFTMSSNSTFERLMVDWSDHHGLLSSTVRFVIGNHEIRATDTPLGLAVTSVIPEHILGVTPLPDASCGGNFDAEVEIFARPRRLRLSRATSCPSAK